jgi:hypothetical protein
MATLKQSSNVNMAGWQPAPVKQQPVAAQSPPTDTRNTRSPRMLASMPLMASTSDSLTRQFYGGQNLPTYRILPVKKGSGS